MRGDKLERLPYDPKSIDFLIVTHVHIDHIGRIPRLVKEGFRGKILSTEATKTLAEPLLLDSMEILASEARRCNREPLYDEKNVETLWDSGRVSRTTARSLLQTGSRSSYMTPGISWDRPW